MKIAIQISTPTLGDIVIEQAEEKTTRNEADQRAILTELLFQVLHKVQSVYSIPQDMLDIGDYESADHRHQIAQAQPKPSSAEKNRNDNLEKESSTHAGSHCKCSEQVTNDFKEDISDEEDGELTEIEELLALSIINGIREAGIKLEAAD